MTSRDELLRLAEWWESWGTQRLGTADGQMADKTAAAIRELLAQEPVAWLQNKVVDSYLLPGSYETCAPTDYGAFAVYAAPVPAVDLQAELDDQTKWAGEYARRASDLFDALLALTEAYSQSHSPQHRAACLTEAKTVLATFERPKTVPAVDLEAFKQEAMRLARECSHRLANEANWHALAAHLDKLGGK